MARSRGVPVATVVLAAFALWGCGGFRSVFPRHEDVFTPIPVSLGEVRLEGDDTLYVVEGSGYELLAREREHLPEVKKSLDQLAVRFRRHMGVEPSSVVVALRAVRRGDARRRGGDARSDSARLAPPDGRPLVTLPVGVLEPRDARARGSTLATPIRTSAVTRAWLAAHAAKIRDVPAPGGADSAPRQRLAPRDDPNIPDWIEVAAPGLIDGSPLQELALRRLASRTDSILPLRTLFESPRPGMPSARGDSVGPHEDPGDDIPVRRIGRGAMRDPAGGRVAGDPSRFPLSGAELFDAQSLSVAQFLVAREGSAFLGIVYDQLVAGATMPEVLRGTRSVPRTLDEFEAEWRAWLRGRG